MKRLVGLLPLLLLLVVLLPLHVTGKNYLIETKEGGGGGGAPAKG